jgi:hypothetical protein
MAFVTPTDVATGEVLTASRYNQDVVENMDSLPRGYVKHDTKTTNTSYTGTAADVISVASVAFLAGRRYRITAMVGFHASGANLTQVRLYRDATVIGQAGGYSQSGTNEQGSICLVVYIAPGAATSTVKFDIRATAGNTVGTALGSATQPALLLIEDIGPT